MLSWMYYYSLGVDSGDVRQSNLVYLWTFGSSLFAFLGSERDIKLDTKLEYIEQKKNIINLFRVAERQFADYGIVSKWKDAGEKQTDQRKSFYDRRRHLEE